MAELETAASRYDVEVVRTSRARRAWSWFLTLAGAALDHAPAPSLRRARIVDRNTGREVASIDEDVDANVDVIAMIQHDLHTMSLERFERVWVQGSPSTGEAR